VAIDSFFENLVCNDFFKKMQFVAGDWGVVDIVNQGII